MNESKLQIKDLTKSVVSWIRTRALLLLSKGKNALNQQLTRGLFRYVSLHMTFEGDHKCGDEELVAGGTASSTSWILIDCSKWHRGCESPAMERRSRKAADPK